MLSLLVTFLGAFLTLIVMRPIANKIGLVDKPNYRKRHQGAIPLIGGVSLFMGNLCYYLMVFINSQLYIRVRDATHLTLRTLFLLW